MTEICTICNETLNEKCIEFVECSHKFHPNCYYVRQWCHRTKNMFNTDICVECNKLNKAELKQKLDEICDCYSSNFELGAIIVEVDKWLNDKKTEV